MSGVLSTRSPSLPACVIERERDAGRQTDAESRVSRGIEASKEGKNKKEERSLSRERRDQQQQARQASSA